jgi:hypothetical protein
VAVLRDPEVRSSEVRGQNGMEEWIEENLFEIVICAILLWIIWIMW